MVEKLNHPQRRLSASQRIPIRPVYRPRPYRLPKKRPLWLRAWAHHHLSQYRRLVIFVVLINLLIFGWQIISNRWWIEQPVSIPFLCNMVVGNIGLGVLLRNQHVINLLFKLATAIPHSAPLWLRTKMAKVYHFGGLHAGGAVMGLVWFAIFAFEITYMDLRGSPIVSDLTLQLVWALLTLLTALIVFALPPLRSRFHDCFELIHRFGGWLALILFWWLNVEMMILSLDGLELLISAATSFWFWSLTLMTLSVLHPWLALRRVAIEVERPSGHVAFVRFNHGVTPPTGSTFPISLHPFTEWHPFANIPTPNKSGFRFVISRAGDWTTRFIDTPPSHVWIKGIPTAGVVTVHKLFKRVVWIATGSGIAPILPNLLSQEIPARLLWSTREPIKTYGQGLVDEILAVEPGAVIWDTDALGRPDLVKLAHELVVESKAEAVIVISNQKLTRQVVYGLEARGIPAYGAIWDS